MTIQLIQEQFGACLNYASLDEPILDLYAIVVEIAEQALSQAKFSQNDKIVPYQCYVGFPLKPGFNAGTCDLDQGGSIIAINAAVPYLIFSACFIYSARVDVNSGLPVEVEGKLLVYDTKFELLAKLPTLPATLNGYFDLFDQLFAKPEYRAANLTYAMFLYTIAIRFVVMHEVMHIVLGHTAYIQKELSFQHFLEFSTERESEIDYEFLHCLEFLADRNAIRGIARKMADGDPAFSSQAEIDLLKETDMDREDYILRGIMTAATLMFHLFPANDESLRQPIHSHPNPYIRSQWLAMELGHEMGKQFDFLKSILIPMAYTAATLNSNFLCPGNWRYATEQDSDPDDGGRPNISDSAYQNILRLAQTWSDRLYINYAPKFITKNGVLIP